MDSIRDAERRVKEMNILTTRYLEQGNRYLRGRTPSQPQKSVEKPRFEPVRAPITPPPPPICAPPPPTKCEKAEEKIESPAEKKAGLLDGLGLDDEKLMILILLVILIKNRADVKLLAALGYLLL